jgi:hypothetical protein
MQELGWAVGRNVRIDYRWGASNFDPERMRKCAVELVALAPDVVLACQRRPTGQGCRSRIKSFRGFQLKQGGYL